MSQEKNEIKFLLKGVLKQLHGSFMVIAWLIAASIGVLMPRYMKKTWVGKQLMGKDMWFAVSCHFLRSVFIVNELVECLVPSRIDGLGLDVNCGWFHYHFCRYWRLGFRIRQRESSSADWLHYNRSASVNNLYEITM